MSLKKCRECGYMISSRAKACPRCGAPPPQEISQGCGCLIILLTVVGVGYVVNHLDRPSTVGQSSSPRPTAATQATSATPSNSSTPSAPSMPRSVGTGGIAVLRYDSGDVNDVFVAVTEDARDRFVQLASAHDREGAAQMVLAGKLFIVPVGTRCRVIDPGVFTYEVRILDGAHQGQSGFVDAEFVKPN